MPDPDVAAINSGEQRPNSISEVVFHPDLTIMQQHIVSDIVR